jgi:hypothetical protein
MNNPPDPRPVYEYDQVITIPDILALRNGYIYQYQNTRWYEVERRWRLRAGLMFCNEILHWLYHGKPRNGITCPDGGKHNG